MKEEGLLRGKRAIVFGIANDHSIAWAIAQAMHREGAELAFTYVGESLERRVRPLAEQLGVKAVLECDVARDEDIVSTFERLGAVWESVDIVVHAVAFAPREELKGRFVDTTREGFRVALDISVYSFLAIARAALPRMKEGGALLTLSYLGAERALPNYNVMGVAKAGLESCVRYLAYDLGPQGVRVNAISAGPIRTLSSAGIAGFKDMLRHHAETAPLKRNVSPADVADTAVYLCGDWARGVTGEVIHVDAGYSIVGI